MIEERRSVLADRVIVIDDVAVRLRIERTKSGAVLCQRTRNDCRIVTAPTLIEIFRELLGWKQSPSREYLEAWLAIFNEAWLADSSL